MPDFYGVKDNLPYFISNRKILGNPSKFQEIPGNLQKIGTPNKELLKFLFVNETEEVAASFSEDRRYEEELYMKIFHQALLFFIVLGRWTQSSNKK